MLTTVFHVMFHLMSPIIKKKKNTKHSSKIMQLHDLSFKPIYYFF